MLAGMTRQYIHNSQIKTIMLAGMTRQYSKRGGTKSVEGTISVINHGYLSEMVPRTISVKTLSELKDAILKEWETFTPDFLRNFVFSMTKRLKLCIQNKGEKINY